MERFSSGDIVLSYMPFTDLSGGKNRPNVVIATVSDVDMILCPITTQTPRNDYAIEVEAADFYGRPPKKPSYIRPEILFTSDLSLVDRKIGRLTPDKLTMLASNLCEIVERAANRT